jgi:GNAT superfamily N-acetyltransferase
MTSANDGAAGGDVHIRRAGPADLADIERIVTAAFSPYIPRLGRPPGVMKNDYAAFISAGAAFVLCEGGAVRGLVVLTEEPEVLYVDTLGVDPAAHGRGHGRALLAFAEGEARARGFAAIRLCTNQVMHENLTFYPHLGWRETHRGVQAGFERVFYRKEL